MQDWMTLTLKVPTTVSYISAVGGGGVDAAEGGFSLPGLFGDVPLETSSLLQAINRRALCHGRRKRRRRRSRRRQS